MMKNLILIILLNKTLSLSISGKEITPNDKIEFLVFFFIFGIMLGIILLTISQKLKIPYSPFLFITGFLIGIFYKNLNKIGDSMNVVVNLSSYTFQFVFLPPLIFESAFNSNFFIFKQRFLQIIVLATFGVGLFAFMIAVVMKYIYMYNFGWGESLTIGAIVASTDPVALVSVLKELGTSIKFNMLLEGESLFNNGTAAVYFWVFFQMISVQFSWSTFFGRFARMMLGGIAFGYLMAIIFYKILKNFVHKPVLFTVLNIISCYFIYFLAASRFFKIEVSGILSLVMYGIYLGEKLRGRLKGVTEEMAHSIWGFITFILSTSLTLISGGFLGHYFSRSESNVRLALNYHDIWKLILFNFILIIVRFLMLVTFWPLLNVIGTSLNSKDILMLTYAGFRGAIVLSLALIVATSNVLDTAEFKNFQILCLYYVAGTKIFSAFIYSFTIKYFVKKLNYVAETDMKQKYKIIIQEKILKEGMYKMEALKKQRWLKKTNWQIVEKTLDFSNIMKKMVQEAILFETENNEEYSQKLE